MLDRTVPIRKPKSMSAVRAVGTMTDAKRLSPQENVQMGMATMPLASRSLLDAARARAGLDDFGADRSFMIGLDRVVDAVESTSPSAYLRDDIRSRILHLLTARLKMTADEQAHPEIVAAPIDRPIIIAGLPRSGTTITFDMLALDPGFRYPRDWEWMMPWPATEAATIESDPRIGMIQPLIDRMAQAAPELAAVQRLDCTAPGECNTGMMYHFSSSNYYAEFGIAKHADWLVDVRPDGLYRDHKRLLQQMQWRGPKGRWLLKSPQHLFDLEGLFGIYPDATVICTHRDPVATFSSLASMLTLVQRSVRLDPDPLEVGRVVVELWGKAILNAVADRDENPAMEDRILDLSHKAIIQDPVGAMRQIYEHAGEQFTDVHRHKLIEFRDDQAKAQRLGKHRHDPSMFGIDPEGVKRYLAPYYETYGTLL